MVDLLITNIKGLVQVRDSTPHFVAGAAMSELPVLNDAFLMIHRGRIADYGPMSELPGLDAEEVIDATDRFVFPGFVDSHTHLIYAEPREAEFEMKIRGATYEEIASKGGGILQSARKLQGMSDDELFERAMTRIQGIIRTGTVVVEIKSGYGLTVKDELKMLRVARRIGKEGGLRVKTTLLGAHAVPQGMTKPDYLVLVIDEMIPAAAAEKLADYVDVFCERGFFSVDDTLAIAEAAKKYSLRVRIHANQLHRSGGVEAGVQVGAISVDHLENIGEEEIELLKGTPVMPTALPGAAFFLNLPFPPAREMIARGLPLAIASDFNPGSSPSGNIQLMLSLACIKMRLTPQEAVNASTINTAYALELLNEFGSITRGKVASIFITHPMNSIAYLPYNYGANSIWKVIVNGKTAAEN